MHDFTARLATLWPEIVLLIGAVLCLVAGLSPSPKWRRRAPAVAGVAIAIAWIIVCFSAPTDHPFGFGGMVIYLKHIILVMGGILLLINVRLPRNLLQNKLSEQTSSFEPGDSMRGEYFAFFLFSLAGAMLTAGATDLVWLFLALELSSLPTYIMIATSRDNIEAQESGVKYFFLGALSAAVFLYGFAFIYGATGFTEFGDIHAAVVASGGPSNLMILGIVLSILGLCFKIAAVPMHVYAADVYEGAASPLTAFLAFVPKTAGFAGLILVVALVGWDPLPQPIAYLLMGIAVLTMTVGNVLGLLQKNVKRVLAYSSIAHSGYILTGIIVGMGVTKGDSAMGNGLGAVLFYLFAYGLGTVGSFAVLASLHMKHEDEPDNETRELQSYEELSGLWHSHPYLAALLLVSLLSMMGMPPLVGFIGKVYLIGSVFVAGPEFATLAVIMVVNSAISAGYYLRISMTAFFGPEAPDTKMHSSPYRIAGATIASVGTFLLGGYFAHGIIGQTDDVMSPTPQPTPAAHVVPVEETAMADPDEVLTTATR